MGDSLHRLLIEEKESDPFILLKYMKHAMKAIDRLREQPSSNVAPNKSLEAQADPRIESMLQKAESDIRQHIRVPFSIPQPVLIHVQVAQQLRLLVETLQSKYEDLEKDKAALSSSSKSLMKVPFDL